MGTAAPSHALLVTAHSWHQTHSRQETGLLEEVTAADRALASASPARVPLHVGAGRSSDTPGPGRASSHPGFCTLTKQKWLQQGSNDKKSSEGNPQEFLNEQLQQNRISIVLEKHLFQKLNDYMCHFHIWHCQQFALTQTQKTEHKNNQ